MSHLLSSLEIYQKAVSYVVFTCMYSLDTLMWDIGQILNERALMIYVVLGNAAFAH